MVTEVGAAELTLNIWVESVSSITSPPAGLELVAVPHTRLPSCVTATFGVLLQYVHVGFSTVMALNSVIWLLPSSPINTLLKSKIGEGVVEPMLTKLIVNTA